MSVFTTVFRIHWKFFIVLRFRLKIFRSNVFPEKYRHQIRNLSKPEFRNRNTRITHLWSLLWCIRCWIGTGLVNSNYKVGYCHFTWSHLLKKYWMENFIFCAVYISHIFHKNETSYGRIQSWSEDFFKKRWRAKSKYPHIQKIHKDNLHILLYGKSCSHKGM